MNLDEYAVANTRRGGVACTICVALPADLRAEVDAAKGVYTCRTIAEWLTNVKEYPTKKSTVETHLREHRG